jgi:hypothetical protein
MTESIRVRRAACGRSSCRRGPPGARSRSHNLEHVLPRHDSNVRSAWHAESRHNLGIDAERESWGKEGWDEELKTPCLGGRCSTVSARSAPPIGVRLTVGGGGRE